VLYAAQERRGRGISAGMMLEEQIIALRKDAERFRERLGVMPQQQGMSVPDMAAKLVGRYENVNGSVQRLRGLAPGGNWSTMSLAVDECIATAYEGMRMAWLALDRWHQVVKEAAERAQDVADEAAAGPSCGEEKTPDA
jgi:hypothetical protein